MAMNNPYVNEDLKNISEMMRQAIQNVITGQDLWPAFSAYSEVCSRNSRYCTRYLRLVWHTVGRKVA